MIGIAAAFVLGDSGAPSSNGERKTWVSVFDLVGGTALLVYVARRWIAVAAGATLAPGQLHPSGAEGVLLLVSHDRAGRILGSSRRWLEGHLRLIASVIIVLLAVSLVRNGIAGLVG